MESASEAPTEPLTEPLTEPPDRLKVALELETPPAAPDTAAAPPAPATTNPSRPLARSPKPRRHSIRTAATAISWHRRHSLLSNLSDLPEPPISPKKDPRLARLERLRRAVKLRLVPIMHQLRDSGHSAGSATITIGDIQSVVERAGVRTSTDDVAALCSELGHADEPLTLRAAARALRGHRSAKSIEVPPSPLELAGLATDSVVLVLDNEFAGGSAASFSKRLAQGIGGVALSRDVLEPVEVAKESRLGREILQVRQRGKTTPVDLVRRLLVRGIQRAESGGPFWISGYTIDTAHLVALEAALGHSIHFALLVSHPNRIRNPAVQPMIDELSRREVLASVSASSSYADLIQTVTSAFSELHAAVVARGAQSVQNEVERAAREAKLKHGELVLAARRLEARRRKEREAAADVVRRTMESQRAARAARLGDERARQLQRSATLAAGSLVARGEGSASQSSLRAGWSEKLSCAYSDDRLAARRRGGRGRANEAGRRAPAWRAGFMVDAVLASPQRPGGVVDALSSPGGDSSPPRPLVGNRWIEIHGLPPLPRGVTALPVR